MRGKVMMRKDDKTKYGITPAYAGKSVAQAALNVIMRDHPRLCGEKQIQIVLVHKRIGSPPPMRGKVYIKDDRQLTAGITPAYAGKRAESL